MARFQPMSMWKLTHERNRQMKAGNLGNLGEIRRYDAEECYKAVCRIYTPLRPPFHGTRQ